MAGSSHQDILNIEVDKDPEQGATLGEELIQVMNDSGMKPYFEEESVPNTEIEYNASSSKPAYDENRAKLRKGNFIKGILDIDEGMTSYQMTKIAVEYGNKAKKIAKEAYPKDSNTEDAYRHFSWNHISTRSMGSKTTTKATKNHEWGLLLLEPASNYYRNEYNGYRKKGYSDQNAATKAYGKTITWLPTAKDGYKKLCKSNYKFFKLFMKNGNIMDFNNNYYGVNFASKYSSYATAFSKAKAAKVLLLVENAAADRNFKSVWINNRY
ncbi:hypothetical protein [Priestia koreensis]|uniref:Uncharacterized protein n=1 Tax=Priestia koreensis TaxID=284581 RepID=A0A0M0KPV0_9BACI|nr:hypothetical protein [Priestia koreensis]KOO40413.1 hypothetical protein AMD01_20920 [Priestia koreensis]